MKKNHFDVIIVGGSYAGLSAALSLGRALRNVLIIDGNEPCNRYTARAHNFLAHDGDSPSDISDKARSQMEKYETIQFVSGLATKGTTTQNGFEITTNANGRYFAEKLIFASGVRDILDEIEGLQSCWGKSVLHCPYCHGYEAHHQKTGIIGNGDLGFEHARTVSQWSRDLTVFTNGIAEFTKEQKDALIRNKIEIIEKKVRKLENNNGQIQAVRFNDGSQFELEILYTKPPFVQQTEIPLHLGCALTEQGLLEVDAFQRTNITGVFACGDNSTFGRSIAVAVQTGSIAGVFCNKELTDEAF